jgi:putative phosphoesterase
MRYSITKTKPEHIVHLGDHFDDGKTISEEFSHIRFHQVPGNCDRYRCDPWQVEVLCYEIEGVRFYMTHGHRHMVKSGLGHLLADARASGAAAVLFGHTHCAVCEQSPDGLWILNPGSCGSYSGSVGLIEVTDGKISSCSVLRQEDIENLH